MVERHLDPRIVELRERASRLLKNASMLEKRGFNRSAQVHRSSAARVSTEADFVDGLGKMTKEFRRIGAFDELDEFDIIKPLFITDPCSKS